MKQLLITSLIIIATLGMNLKAQVGTSPGDIVSKDNVTVDLIKKIFENSFYEIVETAPTYVQIKDVFNIYIDLDKDNRYFTYSVNWPINTTFSLQDKYELQNLISKDVLLITPYYSDSESSIVIKTTIWLEGGVTVKNIVFAEKIFVKALNLVLDKDTKRIIK
jgi:hypothetical protein